MIKFDLEVREVTVKRLDDTIHQEVVNEIQKLENLEYQLTCKSPANKYQKDSDLDERIKIFLEKNFTKIEPKIECSNKIAFDIALEIHGKNIIFEIEKANKEKILYDYLKAHIYIKSGINCVIVCVPINWVSSKVSENLFKVACERLNLCSDYKMADEGTLKNIILVGFKQYYQNKPLDMFSRQQIHKACEEHFADKKKLKTAPKKLKAAK